MRNEPFQALGIAQVVATAAGSTTTALTPGNSGRCVALHNESTAIAYVKFGASTIDVTATFEHSIPPGARIVIMIDRTSTHIAYKAAAAGNINITRGDGVS